MRRQLNTQGRECRYLQYLSNVGSGVGDLLRCGDVLLALPHPALARAVRPTRQHISLWRQEQRVGLACRHLRQIQCLGSAYLRFLQIRIQHVNKMRIEMRGRVIKKTYGFEKYEVQWYQFRKKLTQRYLRILKPSFVFQVFNFVFGSAFVSPPEYRSRWRMVNLCLLSWKYYLYSRPKWSYFYICEVK